MDRFEEMNDIIAMESLYRVLQKTKGTEEILRDFVRGMKAAGVEFDTSDSAKSKMRTMMEVKQVVGTTVAASVIGFGYSSAAVVTVDGVPFVLNGRSDKIRRWFYCCVKIPGQSKSKIVKITTKQLAKMYSESRDGLDPEKIKHYGRNIAKYAVSAPDAKDNHDVATEALFG